MVTSLPVLEDRMCHARALNNPLRRWLAPAARETDLLAPQPGETVADLGAGVGFYARELLKGVGATGRVYLVDIDSENLALARERVAGDARVTVLVGSAAHVAAIPSGSVDRVLLSLVLCCLVEKEAAMDEVWRILRPGGTVLVTYPRRRVSLRRRASLRVTPERWAALAARHPWRVHPCPRGFFVQRHLLERTP